MAAKLLITGLANTGKTSLLSKLKDVLVIAHDGKDYPFQQPHVNVDTFDSINSLIDLVNSKIVVYKEKYKKFPKTIVFDSVSKIFETIQNNCNIRYTSYAIHTEIIKEIALFVNYLQNTLVKNNINLIMVSHVTWEADTSSYILVGTGNFARKGGFLSEVDNSIFIEVKPNKRTVYNRDNRFPCRTLLEDMPNSMPVAEYDIQKHIELLEKQKDAAADYIL